MRSTPPTYVYRLAATLALVLAAASFTGCVGTSSASGGLFVKDAITDDAKSVYITFTKAQVMRENATTWETIFDGTKTIELLSLNASTAKEQLAALDLTPGAYEKLRISIGDVRVVHHNGTEDLLNVIGNVVIIAEDFTVTQAADLDIVIDFNLEEGIDLAAGTYTPVIEDVQKSSDDHDQDGVNDVEDADDDNDGSDDEDDQDDDGNNVDDSDETDQEHEDEAEETEQEHESENSSDDSGSQDENESETSTEDAESQTANETSTETGPGANESSRDDVATNESQDG